MIISRRFSLARELFWYPYNGSGARLFAAITKLFYSRARRR